MWISAVGAVQGLAWLASLVPTPVGSDSFALSVPVLSSIPSRRAAQHVSARSTLIYTSGVYRLYRSFLLLVNESWLCRCVRRRTPGLDIGVPHAKEAVALRRLSILLRDSRVFQPVTRAATARSEARTVQAIGRRLGEWSAPQRARVLGWTMAFALMSERPFVAIVGSDVSVSVLGWVTRAALLAFACLLVTTSQPAASGWHEWRVIAYGSPARPHREFS